MKRNIHFTLVLLVLLFTPIMPIFSETVSPLKLETKARKSFFKDINFTIGTGLSYLSGQYREIVYPDTTSVNPYLSELLWNLENIFLLNLNLGASKGPWSLDLSLATAVTKGSGIMEDYDWGDYTITDWTNWSTSLIFLDKSFFLDVNSGYKHTINEHFAIPIKFGYKLNYMDWEDKAGKYIYYWDFTNNTYLNNPPAEGDFGNVNGIDYKVIQNIFYASSGILFTWRNITTGFNLALSPFIYTWDLDHHILRNLYFLDSFTANFWYRTELTLNLKTGSKGGFLLTAFLEELPETVGDTFQYDESISNPEEIGTQTGYYEDGAGLASFTWGIKLSYTWTF